MTSRDCESDGVSSVSSGSFSSVVCRICQSQSGSMVRPCLCAGSMGTIHERCLNQWWHHSGKDSCEICLAQYARTGKVLKPMKEWTPPKFDSSIVYKLVAIFCVFVSLYGMLGIFVERRSFERLVGLGVSPRGDDGIRIGWFVLTLWTV